MADKDWRSGTLLGAGYALVVEGRVYAASTSRDALKEMWRKSAERTGEPMRELPERYFKQVCFILPPWQATDGQ